MMKRFLFVCVVLFPALLSMAAPKKDTERPAAFPKVDLLPGSKPYFASVMLDVETNQVAYVMFDGNVSNGYERIYFWVPDDSNYRTPKAFRYNAETKRFGPVKFTPRHDKDEIKLNWWFSWGRHGGAYEHFNYLTGQTTKGTSAIYPRFFFHCDYYRQPRSGSRGESLVDITIPGEIRASVWTNMPSALEPWHTLNFYMKVKLLRDKDATTANFSGLLNYGDHRCEVRALPKETTCTLMVAPYMGKTVYSNDMPWADALIKGVSVKLDYGWYDLNWKLDCPGLRVYSRIDPYVRASPYPITRFDD